MKLMVEFEARLQELQTLAGNAKISTIVEGTVHLARDVCIPLSGRNFLNVPAWYEIDRNIHVRAFLTNEEAVEPQVKEMHQTLEKLLGRRISTLRYRPAGTYEGSLDADRYKHITGDEHLSNLHGHSHSPSEEN